MKPYAFALIAIIALIALAAVPAMATSSDYNSKYVAIDNSVQNVGYLYIGLACQNNIYSKEVIIQKIVPKDPANPPAFTNGGFVFKEAMDGYNPDGANETVTLNWAGGYDTEIPPGLYFLTLPDGVGGLPEYRIVEIAKGYTQIVTFVGHVADNLNHDAAPGVLTIEDAQYGGLVTETVSGDCHQVIDVPAHKEYRYQYLVPATYKTVCDKHGHNCHQEVDVPAHYVWSDWQTTNPHKSGQEEKYVPATYKTVCSPNTTEQVWEGKDVTDKVQDLVANGELHIVADYSSLHYNALFGDPCVGTFKTLTVKYTLNGATGTKTVQEDVDLNIP